MSSPFSMALAFVLSSAVLAVAACCHETARIQAPIAPTADRDAGVNVDAAAPLARAKDDGPIPNLCEAPYPQVGQSWIEKTSVRTTLEKKPDKNSGCSPPIEDGERSIEKRIEAVDGSVVTKLQVREHFREDDSRIVSTLTLDQGRVSATWEGIDAAKAGAETSRLLALAPEVGVAERFSSALPLPPGDVLEHSEPKGPTFSVRRSPHDSGSTWTAPRIA